MIYSYKCYYCENFFDVVKSHTECQRPEICTKCGETAQRVYTVPHIDTTTCHEEPEYNPGLGCIVKGRKHRKEIAKRMNLVEVGNETPDKIHNLADENYNSRMNRDYDA